MRYADLKRLVERTGTKALLDRFGLGGPLAEWARVIAAPTERERGRIIRQDFRACEAPFRQIARGAPTGDPAKVVWIICSMPTVWGLKLDGIFSLALRLGEFSPVAVHLTSNRWNRRYHELFGITRFLNFQSVRAAVPIPMPTPDVVECLRSGPTVRDVLRLTFRQVNIGRVALSNVIDRHKFTKLDLMHPGTIAELSEELVRVQANVLAAERMLARQRPAIALLLEKGLSPMAEIAGVCMAHGVPVVQYVGSQHSNDFVLKRFAMHNRHDHPVSLDPETWEWVKRMSWSPAREAELMDEFADSYRTGSWFNRKFLHQGKQIKSAHAVRQQLGLDPAKKTAVIFSHVLWDATFFYGQALFDDYETWLLQTVRAACANAGVNWVVKLHPDLIWKLKYEGVSGELRDIVALRSAVGTLPEHVKLVPPDTDINSYSFFEVTDYCLTVRGTIGIEMACHGVPVVTAGTGRYAGLGFTVDSASAEAYLGRLARIQDVPPMSRGQVELARRFAYALFKLRLWPMRSFEIVSMPIEHTGHPLDHNVVPRVGSFAELAAAQDMRRVGQWVASGRVDYLQPGMTVA